MATTFSTRIVGTGSYLPSPVIENTEAGRVRGMDDKEVHRVTGIRTRRWAMSDEECSGLADEAARRALDSAGVASGEIEAILVSTTSPDTIFPSTACHLQRRLGIRGIPAFDVAASCTGFLYGLSLADSFIRSGQFSCCLVVASEVKSRSLDTTDGESRILFGDGAGAAVVVREPFCQDSPTGILALRVYSDGAYHDLVKVPAGGSRHPTTQETVQKQLHGIQLDGGVLFRTAVKWLCLAVGQLLDEFHLQTADVKQFIMHQANARMLTAIAKRLHVSEEILFSMVEDFGNTSSASLPIALDHAFRQRKFCTDDLILLGAFGGGLTWGTALVRW